MIASTMGYRITRGAASTAFVLGIVNLWYQALVWLPSQWRRTDHDRDMAIYYAAAVNSAHGAPIYHRPTLVDGPDHAPVWYLYPPHLAALLSIFHGHYRLFSHCWYVLMLACFWGYACLLSKLTTGRISAWGAIVWGLALGLTPQLYRVMSLGNVDPALWVLLAASMAYRGNQTALSIMAMIKPYAVLPWLVYSARRGIRSTLPSVAVMTACTAATVAATGGAAFVEWIRWALPLAGQGTFDPINWSIGFAGLRLARGLHLWHYSHGVLPEGPRLYLLSVSIAGPLATAILTRRWGLHARAMVLFFASMLFAPLCWSTYLILAYVPIAMSMRIWTTTHAISPGGAGRDRACSALFSKRPEQV